MICGTALYGLGAFEKKEMTYATVHFDGGFKKLGEIQEQRVFSNVRMALNDETIFSGDIKKVTADLQRHLEKSKSQDLVTLKDGVKITGNIGIKWIGSEGSFELTIDPIDLVSKEGSLLKVADVITLLEKMDLNMKTKHMEYAQNTLIFSERPKTSSLISKLSAALRS